MKLLEEYSFSLNEVVFPMSNKKVGCSKTTLWTTVVVVFQSSVTDKNLTPTTHLRPTECCPLGYLTHTDTETKFYSIKRSPVT